MTDALPPLQGSSLASCATEERPKERDEVFVGLGDLPGDLMIWVLIVSELLVFGAGLLAFLAVRLTDPAGFALAQDQLHRVGAGVNTLILISSGWLASTGLAAVVSAGQAGQLALGAILLVAWAKAHLILKTYLQLGRIPRVLRGFDIVLGMTMIAMLGLALAG